jgi:hypothetical protein
MKTNKIILWMLVGSFLPIQLLAQTPIDKQRESRETQIQLRKLSKEGSIEDGKKLKSLALQAKGAYDPTQATEAYLDYLKRQKDGLAELKSFLSNDLPPAIQIRVVDLIIQKEVNPGAYLVGKFAKANPELSGYMLKKILSNPQPTLLPILGKAVKTWDEAHQKMFVVAVGHLKAKWALPIASLTSESLRTEQVLSMIKVLGIQSLPKAWDQSALKSVDAIALGEAFATLPANAFFMKYVKDYANLVPSQQAILMIYGSYRHWDGIRPQVWKAVQSNGSTRAAGFQSLIHWSTAQDFVLIADKLGNASLENEVAALQACVTVVLKANPDLSIQLSKLVLKANKKENFVPFVQDVEHLNWLYAAAKLKNENALRAFVRINGKAGSNVTQQVLRYRNALALTENKEIRDQIYKGLGKCNTLNAMRTLHLGLKEPNSKSTAADGLATIFLASPEFQGQMTREWMQDGMSALSEVDQKAAVQKVMAKGGMPTGFYTMFTGQDLRGWKGLVDNPIKRRNMSADTLAKKQVKADAVMRTGWYAKDEELHFTGHGENLCSVKDYQDFEMYVDWKIEKDGDAGIYLRGSPQVQIWDLARTNVGAQVGSGGLYNNTKNPKNPLKVADNPIDEWNTFRIIMKGERVTVYLNGELVVDQSILENYWDRKIPIFIKDAIELQAHGNHITYRNIYVKELTPEPLYQVSEQEKSEGFETLFDGSSLFNWTGNTVDYVPENGELAIYPKRGGKGNLYTQKEYGDFHMKFEFQLTPGANNGLGIRAPLAGDAAYVAMELQILDNTAPIYAKLQAYQYHGSVYGIIPAKQGFLKPVGEWNQQEVIAVGNKIKVILNGEVILDGDIAEATKSGTADHKEHPGLFNKTGHIGFLGHGDSLRFRNLRIKEIVEPIAPAKKRKKS